MALYLGERIRELRDEIGRVKLQAKARQHEKTLFANAERQRIRLRLEEIKAELTRLAAPKED